MITDLQTTHLQSDEHWPKDLAAIDEAFLIALMEDVVDSCDKERQDSGNAKIKTGQAFPPDSSTFKRDTYLNYLNNPYISPVRKGRSGIEDAGQGVFVNGANSQLAWRQQHPEETQQMEVTPFDQQYMDGGSRRVIFIYTAAQVHVGDTLPSQFEDVRLQINIQSYS